MNKIRNFIGVIMGWFKGLFTKPKKLDDKQETDFPVTMRIGASKKGYQKGCFGKCRYLKYRIS